MKLFRYFEHGLTSCMWFWYFIGLSPFFSGFSTLSASDKFVLLSVCGDYIVCATPPTWSEHAHVTLLFPSNYIFYCSRISMFLEDFCVT